MTERAEWTTYWGGISIRECPPGSPPWWSEQMAINLRTNRVHTNSSEVLRRLAARWCRRHDRSVFAFGSIDFDDGVWAKVYPTDPAPSYRAFVALYSGKPGGYP